MSETKFTKGEWFVEKNPNKTDFQGAIKCHSSERNGILNSDKPQVYIIVENIRHEANAKLIAAAPEMFEALKNAVSVLEREDPDEDSRFGMAIKTGLDAIKKATE